MPTAPPRPCHVPTCPALVTAAHPCPTHARSSRWSSSGRGSTRDWRARREWVRKEHGPWCRLCLGAGLHRFWVQVDHIVPVAEGGTDDYENLQGLCAAHHRAKTARDAAARRG